MDLANKSVVLYQNLKTKTGWILQEVLDDLPKFSKGPLYVSWYEGSQKRVEPVGRDSRHALEVLDKKRLELAYRAAGGKIQEIKKPPDQPPERSARRKKVSEAVAEYLAECRDRQGKSGYGLAARTPETYEYRLCFLVEFNPEAYLDEIDGVWLGIWKSPTAKSVI